MQLEGSCNTYVYFLFCRFGLYNTPFEPELFDIEPPVPAKFSSVPITYATVVSAEIVGGTMVTCPGVTSGPPGFGLASDLDLRELLGIGGKNTTERFEVDMVMTVQITVC
jgi:baculoviral IAP repeat-containing protein 6